jgi:hypothetical protein
MSLEDLIYLWENVFISSSRQPEMEKMFYMCVRLDMRVNCGFYVIHAVWLCRKLARHDGVLELLFVQTLVLIFKASRNWCLTRRKGFSNRK